MTTTINASPTNGLVATGDGSGVLKVQSNGVTTNAIAWVNFNGTGTVAIRASYNVSSITDNGTGDYTINFANALSDANYSVSLCTTEYASTNNVIYPTITGTTGGGATTQTTSALRINTASLGSPAPKYDMALICVNIFGN